MLSFSKAASEGRKTQPPTLRQQLQETTARLRRLTVQRNRLDLDRARDDTRQWVQDRRARTRHLIELGGLVQKAGLDELVDDDRATLLGAFLGLADQLQERVDEHQAVSRTDLLARWRRRGLRAFDADKPPAPSGMREEAGRKEAGAGR